MYIFGSVGIACCVVLTEGSIVVGPIVDDEEGDGLDGVEEGDELDGVEEGDGLNGVEEGDELDGVEEGDGLGF